MVCRVADERENVGLAPSACAYTNLTPPLSALLTMEA